MNTNREFSTCSRFTAIMLCLLGFFGFCGVHRIYCGKVVSGIIQFLTAGLFGIWQIIDFIRIILGGFDDAHGRPLR